MRWRFRIRVLVGREWKLFEADGDGVGYACRLVEDVLLSQGLRGPFPMVVVEQRRV